MKNEQIFDGDTLLAIVVRSDEWQDGLDFISSPEDYVQVGTWKYGAGKELLAHRHLSYPRTGHLTQEFVYVKEGSLQADIFSTDNKPVKSIELKSGDFIILLNGGHGYRVLEENTMVIEVKNGPYSGPEKDRERI